MVPRLAAFLPLRWSAPPQPSRLSTSRTVIAICFASRTSATRVPCVGEAWAAASTWSAIQCIFRVAHREFDAKADMIIISSIAKGVPIHKHHVHMRATLSNAAQQLRRLHWQGTIARWT